MAHSRRVIADSDQEKAIELERIQWVIGTEYGDLSYVEGIDLSYDFAPEWIERELQDKHGFYSHFMTLVTCGGGYGSEAKPEIVDANGEKWVLIGTYAHSGERECPVPEYSEENVARNQCILVSDPYRHSRTWLYNDRNERALRAECPMCEERIGQPHGYIGIGAGHEAVYRKIEDKEEETED